VNVDDTFYSAACFGALSLGVVLVACALFLSWAGKRDDARKRRRVSRPVAAKEPEAWTISQYDPWFVEAVAGGDMDGDGHIGDPPLW